MITTPSQFCFAQHTLFRVDFDAATLVPGDLLWLPHHASLQKAVAKRQAEHLAGRMAAMRALHNAGYSGEVIPGIGSHRQPCWPAGFTGAITHSAQTAIAGVIVDTSPLKQCGLGLDYEIVMNEDTAQRLAEGIVTAEEQQRLLQAPFPFSLALTLTFSAKESLFKALFRYVNTWFGFEAAVISSLESDRLTLTLTEKLGPFKKHQSFTVWWRAEQDCVLTLVRF